MSKTAKLSKAVDITNDDTGEYDCTRKFKGLNRAEENGQKPVAISVRWATDVPFEIRRKLTYRLVEKTNKGTGPNKMPVLVAEGEGLRFISNPMGPETEVYHGLTCIENEAEKTVRFLSTNNYCLYPDFSKGDGEYAESTSDTVQEEPTNQQKKESLITAFGSAKGNRLVSASQRNAMVLQKQTRQEFDKALEAADFSSLDMMEAVLDERASSLSYLPPHHLDARHPHEAFLFEDMLSESEMDELMTYSALFADANIDQIANWRHNKTYSNFVIKQLETLPLRVDERLRKSAMLMHLNLIYALWNCKLSDWKNKNPFPQDLPECLKNKLMSEFTATIPGRHTFSMTRELKDKALLYICALALMANDFIVDFTILEENISRKLKLYFEQLGCKVTSVKAEGTESGLGQRAVLHVPLTFPKARGQKRKPNKK